MINIEVLQEAITLTKEGKIKEAEAIYNGLLKDNPEEYALLSVMGLFYVNIGNFEKASELLTKACSIKETLGTVSALGFAEFERRDYKKAAALLEKSLLYGENPDIYNKLILSLFEIKDNKRAVEFADRMYELYPDDVRAAANKVKSLTQTGRLLDAEKFCIESLKKNPDSTSLWFHLGFLKELIFSDDIQARECYKAALELGNIEAHYNIAVSCQKLGEYEEAENHYSKLLEVHPNEIDTITSLGMCCLAQKKFHEGYELFFKRDKSKFLKMTNNPWKPGDKISEEVVVICDQGFGDHIQFIRYLPSLSKAGAKKITVAARKALLDLFSVNYQDVKFIDYSEINPNIQAFMITDLAYALGIDFDNIPFASGYLSTEPDDIQNNKLKVGLCWEAGSAGIRTMINRTIHIKCFEPLLNLDNIQVYSFQVDDTLGGNSKYPQMINLAKDFKNFSDTARALKAMDAVVTVDTSVAHLAGALGIKTYLLLPYTADWRWFNDTKNTPWYNSVVIFKQTDHISWEEPINNVIKILQAQN